MTKYDFDNLTIGGLKSLINDPNVIPGGNLMFAIYTCLRELKEIYDKRNPPGTYQTNDENLFMMRFFGSYLHQSRLPVTIAYKIACEWAYTHHVRCLTLDQVRYRLAKLDKKDVYLARYGEEAFKAKYGEVAR